MQHLQLEWQQNQHKIKNIKIKNNKNIITNKIMGNWLYSIIQNWILNPIKGLTIEIIATGLIEEVLSNYNSNKRYKFEIDRFLKSMGSDIGSIIITPLIFPTNDPNDENEKLFKSIVVKPVVSGLIFVLADDNPGSNVNKFFTQVGSQAISDFLIKIYLNQPVKNIPAKNKVPDTFKEEDPLV